MRDGQNGDWWYAHHAYHSNGMRPSEWIKLSRQEKGIIMAFIDLKIEAEEKASKKMR
ncbi:hypothetical protein MZV44_003006 [Listeria monocytogenes]|uniref:hypothetical protein n=1 Tax=Listeria monocytogenes TaxID=1639 RepID=UPI00190F8BE3|nr:hypothetical protein [Listeria monocytogenes]EJC6460075.1 hypothetical protein [Listeria monocytogenes]EJT8453803.1 hypothetical protein [Listeria monocytogenes]